MVLRPFQQVLRRVWQPVMRAVQRAQPLSLVEMLERVPRLFVSYWGVIGIEKALPPWVDGLMFAVLALAVGGCVRWAMRVVMREGSLRAALRALLASPYAILFAWQAALTLLFLMWMRTHVGTENSRLLLPGAVSISVLVTRGLWSWLPPHVLHHASLWRIKAFAFEDLPKLGVAGMCVLAASTPLVTLFPAFTTPWLMDARTERLLAPNLIDLRMNGQIRLLNAWLGAPRVIPGQALPVSMMWSRLTLSAPIMVSYRIALEAVDQRGEVVARRRFIPWDGRYPTTQWRPGEVFRDDHLLPIDGSAKRGVATIWLSLVDPAKPGEALKMGDAFRLRIGEVRIDGPAPALA